MGDQDQLCKQVADAFAEAATKVFDDIPNREQLGDFFVNGQSILSASMQAAGWSQRDRAYGLLRMGGYLTEAISKEFFKLTDELPPEQQEEPGEDDEEPEPPSEPGEPEEQPDPNQPG